MWCHECHSVQPTVEINVLACQAASRDQGKATAQSRRERDLLLMMQDRFRDFTFDPARFPVDAMKDFVDR